MTDTALEVEPDTTPDEGDDDGEGTEDTPEQIDGPDAPDDDPQATRPALSEKDVERRMRDLDKASDRYLAAVARILGDDSGDLVALPVGMIPGFVLNPAIAPIPEEQKDAMLVMLGLAEDAQFEDAEDAEMCVKCNGWGKVRTGSKYEPAKTKNCITCGGQGWTNKAMQPTQLQPPPPAYTFDHTPNAAGTGLGAPDGYGRPVGHPHYGIPPAQVGA